MSDTFTLQFPTGEFTHTELAQLNKKTNQQVWTRYQQAIKDGVIISAGERKTNGKGKPSKLWKVNPNPPVKAATPTPVASVDTTATSTPAPTVEKPVETPVQTEPVVVPAVQVEAPKTVEEQKEYIQSLELPPLAETQPVSDTPPVIETPAPTLPETQPATPAVESTETLTVPVVEVNASAADAVDLSGAWQIDETCPVCQNKLWAMKDATGIQVWCDKPQEVCATFESPAGHGKNVKEAFTVIMAKFGPKEKASALVAVA